jgi:hypothetical protein
MVAFQSPLCGHMVEMECWARHSPRWDSFVSPVASYGNGGKALNASALTVQWCVEMSYFHKMNSTRTRNGYTNLTNRMCFDSGPG